MVFTAIQTTDLIESPDQMGVPARSRQYLADNKGLAFVHDLIDFKDSDTWRLIFYNI